jgi:hypothetical protein
MCPAAEYKYCGTDKNTGSGDCVKQFQDPVYIIPGKQITYYM